MWKTCRFVTDIWYFPFICLSAVRCWCWNVNGPNSKYKVDWNPLSFWQSTEKRKSKKMQNSVFTFYYFIELKTIWQTENIQIFITFNEKFHRKWCRRIRLAIFGIERSKGVQYNLSARQNDCLLKHEHSMKES